MVKNAKANESNLNDMTHFMKFEMASCHCDYRICATHTHAHIELQTIESDK